MSDLKCPSCGFTAPLDLAAVKVSAEAAANALSDDVITARYREAALRMMRRFSPPYTHRLLEEKLARVPDALIREAGQEALSLLLAPP